MRKQFPFIAHWEENILKLFRLLIIAQGLEVFRGSRDDLATLYVCVYVRVCQCSDWNSPWAPSGILREATPSTYVSAFGPSGLLEGRAAPADQAGVPMGVELVHFVLGYPGSPMQTSFFNMAAPSLEGCSLGSLAFEDVGWRCTGLVLKCLSLVHAANERTDLFWQMLRSCNAESPLFWGIKKISFKLVWILEETTSCSCSSNISSVWTSQRAECRLPISRPPFAGLRDPLVAL